MHVFVMILLPLCAKVRANAQWFATFQPCGAFDFIPVYNHLWRILGNSCTLQNPAEQPTNEERVFCINWKFDHQSNIFDDATTSVQNSSHLVSFWIVEEVGPVWICLHEPELKKLPETQLKNMKRDLERRGETNHIFSHNESWIMFFHAQGLSKPAYVKMAVQNYGCWIHLHLVPGLLVQVCAVVQWDSSDQLHCQNPGARELIDHFWNLEKVITFQQGSEGKREDSHLNIPVIQLWFYYTPEPLSTFCLPLVVTFPGQLSLKNLQAAFCKQTFGETHLQKGPT